jgi:hypothetical protein
LIRRFSIAQTQSFRERATVKRFLAGCLTFLCPRRASSPRHFRGQLRRRSEAALLPVAAAETLEVRQLLSFQYLGGPLIPKVQAQAVFLGQAWSSDQGLQDQSRQLDTYLHTLVTSTYLDSLGKAGYKVGHGTSVAGVIDNVSVGSLIDDSQIEADLQALINSHSKQVAVPGASTAYVVYVQPGAEVTFQGLSSATDFLGYHSAFKGHAAGSAKAIDIRYAVMPYPADPNFFQSDDFNTYFDQLTAVTSHELSETVTDPNGAFAGSGSGRKIVGWYDLTLDGEIGDVPILLYEFGGPDPFVTFDGYVVQEMASKNDGLIDPNNYPGLNHVRSQAAVNVTPASFEPPITALAQELSIAAPAPGPTMPALFQPIFMSAESLLPQSILPEYAALDTRYATGPWYVK